MLLGEGAWAAPSPGLKLAIAGKEAYCPAGLWKDCRKMDAPRVLSPRRIRSQQAACTLRTPRGTRRLPLAADQGVAAGIEGVGFALPQPRRAGVLRPVTGMLEAM
jgi:hypothetical protein